MASPAMRSAARRVVADLAGLVVVAPPLLPGSPFRLPALRPLAIVFLLALSQHLLLAESWYVVVPLDPRCALSSASQQLLCLVVAGRLRAQLRVVGHGARREHELVFSPCGSVRKMGKRRISKGCYSMSTRRKDRPRAVSMSEEA